MSKHLTRERLRESLDYDPLTGLFTWKKGHQKTRVGDVAGTINNHGYVVVQIDKKIHTAHRLAWLWVYGEFPDGNIDHRNGIRTDNRWSNLRGATPHQNACNRKLRTDSTTGFAGVTMHRDKQRFAAQIGVNGQRYHLGLYRTVEEAAQAYNGAAALAFGEFHREN